MHCHVFAGDIATLIAALTSDDLLDRYQEALAAELPSLADRGMAAHLRRMAGLAAQVRAAGLDAVAANDRVAADGLLTDLFAVARWHGWPLPVEAQGEGEIAIDGLARGFLGCDATRDGAGLWRLPDGRIAFARVRTADPAGAEMRHG
jgi:hypothetical protein